MFSYTTVSVFICLTVSSFCQPSRNYKSGRRDKGAEFTDEVKDSSELIVKRSMGQLAKIGKEAFEYLLNGAEFLKVDASGYRLFQKRGTFKTARKEFKTLRPTNMRISQGSGSINHPVGHFRASGNVGDRHIRIGYSAHNPGQHRFPYIMMDNPGDRPIKIIYKKGQ